MTERFPFGPAGAVRTPPFPPKQPSLRFGPQPSRARSAAERTLDGEDRSGIMRDEGKRIQERGGRAARGSPRRGLRKRPCGDTLLVELRALLHIQPHPQN